MNTLVLYDSQYGNTERIAQAIADALRPFGQARAIRVDSAQPAELAGVELLVLGSPTQGWRPTPAMQAFLDKASTQSAARGMAVACFDTRYHKSHWVTGSAAEGIGKKLRRMRAESLVAPESFFVEASEGPLESGEIERAARWATLLRERYEASQPQLSAR